LFSGLTACHGSRLRRRESARTAILYAFDLIEHNG
jgi:bifunctional non-homologous end joining protein LigD